MRAVEWQVKRLTPFVLCATLLVLSACSEIIRQHGYIPPEEALQEIVVGVDTRDSVAQSIGRPPTTGVLQDSGWFYIGTKIRHYGLRSPKEIEREVLAISFDGQGTVKNIERFGLERGRVVTLSRRVTGSTVTDSTFLRQIIRNFGQIDLSESLGGE